MGRGLNREKRKPLFFCQEPLPRPDHASAPMRAVILHTYIAFSSSLCNALCSRVHFTRSRAMQQRGHEVCRSAPCLTYINTVIISKSAYKVLFKRVAVSPDENLRWQLASRRKSNILTNLYAPPQSAF